MLALRASRSFISNLIFRTFFQEHHSVYLSSSIGYFSWLLFMVYDFPINFIISRSSFEFVQVLRPYLADYAFIPPYLIIAPERTRRTVNVQNSRYMQDSIWCSAHPSKVLLQFARPERHHSSVNEHSALPVLGSNGGRGRLLFFLFHHLLDYLRKQSSY